MKLRPLLLLLLCAGAHAQIATCHVTYGGETRRFTAPPTDSPYKVTAHPVGSYFLFRVVFERDTAIKTYVYADRDNEGVFPLHQARHDWPVRNTGRHGFTGLHFVYEPLRDGELEFWCELY